MAVVGLVVGIVLAFVAIVLTHAAKDNDSSSRTSAVGATLCVIASSTLLFLVGWAYGLCGLSQDCSGFVTLDTNEIYETLSSVQVEKDKWAVVLKDRDGDLSAHLLPVDPPKILKRGPVQNGKSTYEPYPSPKENPIPIDPKDLEKIRATQQGEEKK